jgi:hypothetical protein
MRDVGDPLLDRRYADWLPGKKVLISPKWIERVSWSEKQVVVALTREAIQQAPEYADEPPLTRVEEMALIDTAATQTTGKSRLVASMTWN